ncbi:MAG: PAS domain S-box protein [Desulfobacteraceae bacterium]|nr:MAG: PAS domain S-box protein [Desulfobacteraceae bacterium]
MKIRRHIPRAGLFAVIFFLSALLHPAVYASDPAESRPVGPSQVKEQSADIEDRTLQVRGDHNYPPYEYINDQGKPAGFNVDIILAVANAMGLTVTIDLGPWDEVRAQLEAGKIDALIGMFHTAERDKKFDFSIPHFIASYAVFVRKGSPIQSLDDVKDKKIVVQLKDLGHDYVMEHNITPYIITKKDWSDVLKSLSNGEGDCAIVSRIQGTRLIDRLSITNLEAVGPPIIQRKYCLAVTEGNTALLAKLNEGLSIIKQTGKYDEIYKKWFGVYEDQKLPLVKVFHYLIWIVLPLIFLTIAGFFWSWMLKKQVNLRTIALHNELSERRRAEEATREATMKLQEAVRAAHVGLWDWDLTTNKVHFSAEWKHQIGYNEYEIGNNFEEWESRVHPDDLETTLGYVRRSIAEARPEYRVEFRFRHKDGSYRWILALGSVLMDETGKAVRALGSHIDITERKRTEEELRTTIELLSLFIKHSPIYAFIKEVTPTESRVLRASENYRDMVGITGSEMAGKNMHQLFPAEFAAKITADDWAVVSRGEILRLDEDLNDRSYTTIKFPILLAERNLLAGYTIDITERKRAEEALRKRENQLQRIFEILPIGLWFADKEGRLLRGNPMGVKIWGAEPHVTISEYGMFKAWRLPSREPVKAEDWALGKTIREGVTIVDELLEIESFDGKRKTILNYTAPVLDDNGRIDGAIVVNLDISDRKALENQLLQAQKMESVGRLAGGVAHDFNNMLSVILGHTELALIQLEPDHPLFAYLKSIREAAQRSADLTRQLLAFARRQTVAPKMLDLNETVEGMLKMLRRLIGEDIDLVWMPGGNLGSVKIDPSQIDQILVNLCVNARDAIGDTGKVTIETDIAAFDETYCAVHADFTPGVYVTLTVSDNGDGMDPETLSHLFEPFFTTKGVGKGTGLGLATVYGIVKQNNGFINVYSEKNHGSTFRIYLPRYAANADRIAEPDADKPDARGSETILVVEDEPMILTMATEMLNRLGYIILPAGTPGEAIRMAREHTGEIHLLMTDIVMPEMNGRDLAKNLLSLYPNLKSLFMSGYTANVIAHHGVLNEGAYFIQKPFSLKDLAAKVRETLDT